MKDVSIRMAEIGLLFAALFLCLPPVPSTETATLPLFPSAAFATFFFAASRVLRLKAHWWWALAETVLFSVFAYVLNAAMNLIYVL